MLEVVLTFIEDGDSGSKRRYAKKEREKRERNTTTTHPQRSKGAGKELLNMGQLFWKLSIFLIASMILYI